MAESNKSTGIEEPLFPNLAKAPASTSIITSKLAKTVPSSSTPTPSFSMPPPSNLGYDPNATPTGPFNPGNTPHTEWNQVSVHTAKCDKCSQHNTSVIQRCTRCNFQLCKNCIGNVGDQIHFADIDNLNWIATKEPRGARKNSAAKKTAPKPAVSRMPSNNRVNKSVSRASARNASERTLAQARKQNILTGDDDTIEVQVPQKWKPGYFSGDEYDEFESRKSRHSYPIDSEYMDNGEDTDEDEIVAQKVKRNQDQRRPRDPAEDRHNQRAPSYQRPLGRPSTPGMASAFGPVPSQSGRISGLTFDEAIAQAYEQRQNTKRLEYEQRLNEERKEAWKNNPTIQKLLQEGNHKEAEEMMEIATDMLLAQRGMK